MKMIVHGKLCDTEKATLLAKFERPDDIGQPHIEELYVSKSGFLFVHVNSQDSCMYSRQKRQPKVVRESDYVSDNGVYYKGFSDYLSEISGSYLVEWLEENREFINDSDYNEIIKRFFAPIPDARKGKKVRFNVSITDNAKLRLERLAWYNNRSVSDIIEQLAEEHGEHYLEIDIKNEPNSIHAVTKD